MSENDRFMEVIEDFFDSPYDFGGPVDGVFGNIFPENRGVIHKSGGVCGGLVSVGGPDRTTAG